MLRALFLFFIVLACMSHTPYAHAEPNKPSPFLSGPMGLNTIPNARMQESGTVNAGISTLDPYLNSYLGFQLAEPLFISFRQSAEISSLNEEANRLYPGIDAKLRILKETRSRPEIAIGLQSAIGHKRMAGEYLAASKRYKNFDFTAGVGWGRFGSAAHMRNPLRNLADHFGKERGVDEEMPNEPTNWFTGRHIGFFGGIEYFTPIESLSLKLDYGADRYTAERTRTEFDAPPPWSIGLDYAPNDWMNVALGVQGLEKVMARLSLSGQPAQWPLRKAKKIAPAPLRPARTESATPQDMILAAEKNGVSIFALESETHKAAARLALSATRSAPEQIGLAAAGMANHAGKHIEEFTFTPHILNLRGPSVTVMRRDFENALARTQGSAAEIWQNASFDQKENPVLEWPQSAYRGEGQFKTFTLHLDNQISLSEEDSGTLTRTSLVANINGPGFFGLVHTATSWRLNIHDNLDRLRDIRPPALLPVRSNVADFADQRIALDRLYSSFTYSPTPEIHTALTGGYLEEMYGGAGGEILYRPFGKRFALGGEAWLALKRDPLADLNMGFNGDRLLSGHLNAWYTMPEDALTFQARFGRFLAEDVGAELSLEKSFKNGASLDAFVTLTDQADFDLFGGTTHAHHELRLTLPLGSFKWLPEGSTIRTRIEPFGRDIGQSIDNPVSLYDLTQPFSKEHLARHWDDTVR